MKRILITGATGFVGSHVLEAMLPLQGVELIVACRDPSRVIPAYKGEVRIGDLRDESYRQQLCQGVDVIIHAMAWTSLWGHKKESESLYLAPSLALISQARKAGVKRFVNISTTSAAAPQHSKDPMSHGIPRHFWPHLNNVIQIENALRQQANEGFCTVNMRLGIFAGRRFALGVLPILVPRLRTHLVPWVAGGKTHLPVIDGRDIGRALCMAATVPDLKGYQGFNIVGPEVPTVREVLHYLHDEYNTPLPHFSVPFFIAYPFAACMEWLDRIVPWEPLVTRSIVHLLEEVSVDNHRARELLGYEARIDWRQAVREQMDEMEQVQDKKMKMARPIV